ncbi:hypothetical protein Sjap_007944 [Stephania japonica]|uniref:Uncharacterized protein n=1 Tax=Stephania japonica TaxID=461633 RepID=A0AAP0PE49_9MAGN
MILGWLSQSTIQQPLQEDMQHMIPNSDSEETVKAATLESAKFDEFSIVDEYLNEPEETLEIFYTADTFVLNNHDATESYVLEVPDELLNLKEGMSAELPKAIDAPFVFYSLILVLNLEDKVWDKFGGVSVKNIAVASIASIVATSSAVINTAVPSIVATSSAVINTAVPSITVAYIFI